VALEIARQLNQAGESVELVALFDTYPPMQNRNGRGRGDDLPVLVRFAADMSQLMNIDTSAVRERFLELNDAEKQKLLFETLKLEGVLAQDSSENEFQGMLAVFRRNSMAVEQYHLQPSPGRVVLFHATAVEQPQALAQEWAKCVDGELECYPVTTDHYGMMRRPHVAVVAEQLRRYFEQAEENVNTSKVESGGMGWI